MKCYAMAVLTKKTVGKISVSILYILNDKLGDERTTIKDYLIGIDYSPWIIFLKDPSNTAKAYQTTIRQAVSFLAG